MTFLDLMRSDLNQVKPYQVSEANDFCQLNANELPWDPLEEQSLALNRYPVYKQKQKLGEQLAQCYCVQPEEVLVTRGSDDGIDLIMRLFLKPGKDGILQCPPTFSMYAFYAKLQQAFILNCPLLEQESQFCINIAAIKKNWQPECKLLMLCSPNNPTGDLIDLATIKELCTYFKNKAMLVIDEAYIEFSQRPSAATLLTCCDNLIILRTLSKAYGLAGLRLGIIIARKELIAALTQITAPFPLSTVVMDLASKALEKKSWFLEAHEKLSQLREQLFQALQQRPLVDQIYRSSANFFLIKTKDTEALSAWLYKNHITVRSFPNHPLLKQHLRISVGSNDEQRKLLTAMDAFIGAF